MAVATVYPFGWIATSFTSSTDVSTFGWIATPSGGSTTITASIAQGTVSLTPETLPSVSLSANASIAQGSVSLTPETVTITRSVNATITQGSVALTAETLPSVSLSANASIAQGSVSLTPETITATIVPASPPPPPGTITANIVQATVNLSPQTVTPTATFGVSISQGSVSLTPQTVTTTRAVGASVSTGYVSLTAAGQGTTQVIATVVGSPSNLNFANFGGPGDTLKPKFPFAGVGPVFDSYTMQAGDTVFMKGGASLLNGLYSWDGGGLSDGRWTLTRDTRLQTVSQLQTTMVTAGPAGATNAGTSWINSNVGPITFGTTPLSFAQTGPITVTVVPSANVSIVQAGVTITAFPIQVQVVSAAIRAPFNITASENGWSVTVVDSVATVTVREYVDIVRFS